MMYADVRTHVVQEHVRMYGSVDAAWDARYRESGMTRAYFRRWCAEHGITAGRYNA